MCYNKKQLEAFCDENNNLLTKYLKNPSSLLKNVKQDIKENFKNEKKGLSDQIGKYDFFVFNPGNLDHS